MTPATPRGVKFKAFLHLDGQAFTLAGKSWRATYPIRDLEKWFGFYAKLADPKKNPKSHQHYTGTHEALIGVRKKMEARRANLQE